MLVSGEWQRATAQLRESDTETEAPVAHRVGTPETVLCEKQRKRDKERYLSHMSLVPLNCGGQVLQTLGFIPTRLPSGQQQASVPERNVSSNFAPLPIV